MVRIIEIQNTEEEASEHIQLDDYYIDKMSTFPIHLVQT
jgi:hypothetical protein